MEQIRTAEQAEAWLCGPHRGSDNTGLSDTKALLEKLGSPDKRMGKILHVAGTNGKGSTCAYLSAALRACGYKVGLFTSPHLCRFNERVELNGEPISDEDLVRLTNRIAEAVEELEKEGIGCTIFELFTALACLYYAETGTDYAVMEVGLGGRLDSTNALSTSLCLIAAIGMDHMERLGNTIELIAGEKAGIMKPAVPVVVMRGRDSVMRVFEESAGRTGSPLYVSETPKITEFTAEGCVFACTLPVSGEITQRVTVPGEHQAANAALALSGLDLLGIDMEKARRGVEHALWEGRLQKVGNILVDCGHNPQGAESLKSYVQRFFADCKKVLLTGMMQDKQIETCAQIFGSVADAVVCTAVPWPRAISPEGLAAVYGRGALAVPGTENALREARRLAGEDGLILCAGSVYLAGEVLNLLKKENEV